MACINTEIIINYTWSNKLITTKSITIIHCLVKLYDSIRIRTNNNE